MLERARKDFGDFINVMMLIRMEAFPITIDDVMFAYFICGEWIKKSSEGKLPGAEANEYVKEAATDHREFVNDYLIGRETEVSCYLRLLNMNLITRLDKEILLDVIALFGEKGVYAELKEELNAISEAEFDCRE